MIVAARVDLGIARASVVLVFAAGGLAGLAAGFFGGWVDAVVGRIADTIMPSRSSFRPWASSLPWATPFRTSS